MLLWEDALPPLAAAEAAADRKELAKAGEEAEDEDDTRPGWTFLELQSLSQKPADITVPVGGGARRPSWYPTLMAAVEASIAQAQEILAPSKGGARESPPELLEALQKTPILGGLSPPTPKAPAAFPSPGMDPDDPPENGKAGKKKKKAVADMQDGNGAATPGAYGDAEDFWDGWSEGDEDEEDEEPEKEEVKVDEDGYWAAYDGEESQIGDEEGTIQTHSSGDTLQQQSTTPRESISRPAPPHRVSTRDRSDTITPSISTIIDAPPSPAAHFGRFSTASSVVDSAPSFPPHPGVPTLSPPITKEQLYFSNSLPPLSPSHFGVSPTQVDPQRAQFYAPTASLYSTQSPRPQSMASPPMPEVHRFRHARAMSDVSKALPSFPTFPLTKLDDLPTSKSDSKSTIATPAATHQFKFPSTSTTPPVRNGSPSRSSPSASGKATVSPKLSSSKALPPAPSQIEDLAPQQSASQLSNSSSSAPPAPSQTSPARVARPRKGPPAPLSPASTSRNGLTPPLISAVPLSPRSPGEKPTPPRPGSQYFPLRTAPSTAPVPHTASFSGAPPVPFLPQNFTTTSKSGYVAPLAPRPSMAPPPAPDLTQHRRFGSLDSAVSASTISSGLLHRDSFAAGYEGVGLAMQNGRGSTIGGGGGGGASATVGQDDNDVEQAVEALRGVDDSATREKEDVEENERADEALRTALRGVWGLYALGPGTTEDRRRRFERAVQDVIRAY